MGAGDEIQDGICRTVTGLYGEKEEGVWVIPMHPLTQGHGVAVRPLSKLWAF